MTVAMEYRPGASIAKTILRGHNSPFGNIFMPLPKEEVALLEARKFRGRGITNDKHACSRLCGATHISLRGSPGFRL